MVNIYVKPTCPYCTRVLLANEQIKAPLNLLDITADPAHRETLIQKGGKPQVPFLEDVHRNVSMYESLDIIAYLKTHYGNAGETEAPSVCPID